MQPSILCILCAAFVLGLCLTGTGCSDQMQFTTGVSPVSDSGSARTMAGTGSGENATEEANGTETITAEGDAVEADTMNDTARTTVSTARTLITIDELQALCNQGTKQTLSQSIRFPETSNCQFNKAGNLGRKDGYLQAVQAQTTTISLPDNSQLCDVSVQSAVSTIQYDDFLILTLNGYVLLSSNTGILNGLQGTADSALRWDFTRVRGMAVDFDSPSYCMGTGSDCTIPVTDTAGRFEFKVDPTSLIQLGEQVLGNQDLTFSLLATGDNDDRDCWHTELNLNFTFNYVQAR